MSESPILIALTGKIAARRIVLKNLWRNIPVFILEFKINYYEIKMIYYENFSKKFMFKIYTRESEKHHRVIY